MTGPRWPSRGPPTAPRPDRPRRRRARTPSVHDTPAGDRQRVAEAGAGERLAGTCGDTPRCASVGRDGSRPAIGSRPVDRVDHGAHAVLGTCSTVGVDRGGYSGNRGVVVEGVVGTGVALPVGRGVHDLSRAGDGSAGRITLRHLHAPPGVLPGLRRSVRATGGYEDDRQQSHQHAEPHRGPAAVSDVAAGSTSFTLRTLNAAAVGAPRGSANDSRRTRPSYYVCRPWPQALPSHRSWSWSAPSPWLPRRQLARRRLRRRRPLPRHHASPAVSRISTRCLRTPRASPPAPPPP